MIPRRSKGWSVRARSYVGPAYLTSKAESLPPKAISPESPKYAPVLSTTRKADISEMR